MNQGMRMTPEHLFLAMVALAAFMPRGASMSYWAYLPNPPVLQPVTWQHGEVIVYTNDTWLLGGHSNRHIKPAQATNYSYQGGSKDPPMCFALNSGSNGCWLVNWTRFGSHFQQNRTEVPNWNGEPWKTPAGLRWILDLWYPKNKDFVPIPTEVPPPDLPICFGDPSGVLPQIPWKECRNEKDQRLQSPWNDTIIDWSWRKVTTNYSLNPSDWKGFAVSYWSMGNGPFQTQLWRLVAAMGGSFGTNETGNARWFLGNSTAHYRQLQACVPSPYALLVGNFNITKKNGIWSISCPQCTLNNCLSSINAQEQLMVMYQPAFVMIPVNVSET